VMEAAWAQLIELLDAWGLWIVIGSVALYVISLVSTPYIITRIPADYFIHDGRYGPGKSLGYTVTGMIVAGSKNILGAILLLAGFVMLFTPGPGMATILFGLMMMNFPGKYRLEYWIISRPFILHQVNAMREKRGQPPLKQAAKPR